MSSFLENLEYRIKVRKSKRSKGRDYSQKKIVDSLDIKVMVDKRQSWEHDKRVIVVDWRNKIDFVTKPSSKVHLIRKPKQIQERFEFLRRGQRIQIRRVNSKTIEADKTMQKRSQNREWIVMKQMSNCPIFVSSLI